MGLLKMILAVFLLLCFIYQVNGETKMMPDHTSHNSSDHSASNSDAPLTSNLTNNTIVNITTDVVLSFKVTIEGVQNITIIGQKNPVVKCNDVGAVKFISCKNITIKGIQWEGCGSMDYPGIELYNSSDVSFKRCSFYNSKGKSVLMSEMTGNINIIKCNFTHTNSSGHGSVVHYVPSVYSDNQHCLFIQNSNFLFNQVSHSVVYIDGSDSRITGQVYLQDSTFVNNTGIPVHISYCNLYIEGSVLFHGNTAMYGGAIYSNNSAVMYFDKSDVNFLNNSATNDGGAIYLDNSTMRFEANALVTFNGNSAQRYGGAVYSDNSNVAFDGNSTVIFFKNEARLRGGAVYCRSSSHIKFDSNSNLIFNNNEAWTGGAVCCEFSSYITFDGNSSVTFTKNKAKARGGAYYGDSSNITFDDNSNVTFNNNEASFDGGAVYCYSSDITFDDNSSVTFNNNKASYDGGAVYCWSSSHITFDDNSSVTFNNNKASYDGGAVYCWSSFHITFDDNSSVTFNNNKASYYGGAVYCWSSFHITFYDNSSVTFNNNEAHDGGAVYFYSSHITFNDNSSVTFNNNEASDDGGAVYCAYSSLNFDGNSVVTLNDNEADFNGGAVYFASFSHITFNGSSNVTFNNNKANDGGAVNCRFTSLITFGGNSSVTFINNEASNGGAVYCDQYCITEYNGHTQVLFDANRAMSAGGALFSLAMTKSKDNSTIKLINNRAIDGGAIHSGESSSITFDQHSVVWFYNNTATQQGGAIIIVAGNITFTGSLNISFINNKARQGAAIHFASNAQLLSSGNCSIIFQSNFASYQGGALYLFNNVTITLKEESTVMFIDNTAQQNGGAIYAETHVNILVEENCTMSCTGNRAGLSGGALYITENSTAVITGYCKVKYSNNKGFQYGGAIYCVSDSRITFNGTASVTFTNNTSEFGGALSILQSIMKLDGNGSVNFTGNKAENGGAILVENALASVEGSTQIRLLSNSAIGSGGAIHLSSNFTVNIFHNSNITFHHNSANRYGGAIYCDLTKNHDNKLKINTTDTTFDKNNDVVSSDVYLDIPVSCDETCLNNSIIISGKKSGGIIKTSPRKLKLNDSVATCISNGSNTFCERYLTRNVMLGQEISIKACVLDYYNQPAESTQFELRSEDQDHQIIRPDNVLISCGLFEGVRIMGKEVLEPKNFSFNLTSFQSSVSDLKKFSTELVTELSPCHPGFHYDHNDTQTCVCYSDNDIVSCSGSTSSIKRGYWFGEVDGKATVTTCPNSYCNFSCCETANGFFELSPVRANQCNSQRSGTACGSCKKGFTLSFDSIECVSVNKCTTGQTVLVVVLSILYWVVIVILVFIVTYYHSGIGYLYAITYYYSMVDILLGEHLYKSQGLFIFVSVISSTAKVKPQFLGQLCLVTNMSGIDQQFIHYVHPLAVAIIVIIICILARMSYKFSSLVSRGIIHVICFLLLLSYTSVATTSSLLLRSLTFDNVDKVYTYLSPDIEYFHGRHLSYVLTAILCTLLIVIGLPLLLLLEPFLNHKIDFTRIKPLLDQFQGCYKDRYRSFAAYYMTCRLVIILIIIAYQAYSDTSQYLLVVINSLLALMHMTIKPYRSNILNLFDGFVLHLMIVVSMVPLINSYDRGLLVAFMVILVNLPLTAFLIMELYLYKNAIKKVATYCVPTELDTTHVTNEVPMRDFVNSVIDDSTRVNSTICTIKGNDYAHHRDSFIEVMDSIED